MNPELRRNLWLEFSPHRLIAVPVLIALMLLLVLAMGEADRSRIIAGFAAAGYGVMVLFWGTQRAGMSVLEEVRERTWDAQRMSAIGPWAMTWGKLLGAPAFTWYAGLMLLAVFVASGWHSLRMPVPALALSMLAAGLTLHALALAAGLLAARRGMARRGGGFALMVALLFFLALPTIHLASQIRNSVTWWSFEFDTAWFLLASLCAYGAWAVLGAYRSMCGELGLRTLPWALPAFIAFSACFLAGFAHEARRGGDAAVTLFVGTLLALALAYATLLGEASGAPAAWQRLLAQSRAGHARRVLQDMPLWLVALACAMLLALASLLAPRSTTGAPMILHSSLLPLTLTLFVLRDAAIVQFFALARGARRAEAAALFYLLLLYLLLPGLLSAVALDGWALYLRPSPVDDPGFACAVMALQAVLALGLALWRWRRVHGPDAATPKAAAAP
jgi:hypothetical protein